MGPTKVVIDTNVLIAALETKNGAAYKLLINLSNGYYLPNISVPLFIEYEAVAKRQDMLTGLSSADINAILDYILSKSDIRKIFYLWRPYLRDPKDDLVLEVAVESQSEYIITFSKKDFSGVDKFGISLSTPHEFMKEIGF